MLLSDRHHVITQRTESLTYDSLNRLTSVTDNQGQTTTYEYDAVGNQTHIRYPNGLISISEFDDLNRVTAITTRDADDNMLTRYAYALDSTGRRLSLSEHTGRTSTYVYDDIYRLTQESIVDPTNGDHFSQYTYGPTGNRTQSTVNGVITDYAYDDNDRLLSQGNVMYTYDDQGNTLTETDGVTVKTFGYDAKQRMISFTDGTQTVNYQYNPDGIRTRKSVGGDEVDYVVDTNRDYAQVVAELGQSNAIDKEYVFGADLISLNDDIDTHYLHYDSLGTTRNLSNNSALISDSYFYEAFGETLVTDGTTNNNYLFNGEQFEKEQESYYLRARYYNQELARFTQMDEYQGRLLEPNTLHKYMFAHADPVNGNDPSGYMTMNQLLRALDAAETLYTLTKPPTQVLNFSGPGSKGKVTAGQIGAGRLIALLPGGNAIKLLRLSNKRKQVKNINGNNKLSGKRQHLYRIDDKGRFDTFKYGISGGLLNRDGSSRRGNTQANYLNKTRANGRKRFVSFVMYRNLANRIIALAAEHALVCAYKARTKQQPEGNLRPICQI